MILKSYLEASNRFLPALLEYGDDPFSPHLKGELRLFRS